MTDFITVRHTVTNKIVEITAKQFAAMAFTPLGNVYVPVENPGGCISCGPEDSENVDEIDYSVDEDDQEGEVEGDFFTMDYDKKED